MIFGKKFQKNITFFTKKRITYRMNIKKYKYSFVRSGMLLLLLSFVLQTTKAQSPVYSQFMFDALSVNPGLTGINDYHKFTLGYRNQFVQINHAFVTFFASYDQHVEQINSGIGFQIYRDVAGGIYSRTSAELFYSYRFQLTNDLIVSPGLQLAVVQRAMDASNFIFPDQNEIIESKSRVFPDFGFGVVVNYSDRYSFGLAAHHLNGPVETLSEINSRRTPMSLSAHFISYFPLRFGRFDRYRFVFSPGVYFRQQQYQNFMTVGMNFAYNPVFVGLWMRTAAGFNPESTIFMVGLEQTNFRIVYNFDYKLATAKREFINTGAHEIVLSWKIHPRKRMQAIKCSKFSLEIMNRVRN